MVSALERELYSTLKPSGHNKETGNKYNSVKVATILDKIVDREKCIQLRQVKLQSADKVSKAESYLYSHITLKVQQPLST